jgi:hypothetical protein
VPGPGYIAVEGNVYVKMSHAEGIEDRLFLAISESPTDMPIDFTTMTVWEISSTLPADTVNRTFYVHNTFRVYSGGTYTYYLVGMMDQGQDAGDLFWYAHLRGVYYPDAPSVAAPVQQDLGRLRHKLEE